MIQYTVPMRILFFVCALPLCAQLNDNRLSVTGDAEIKVQPDRVVISVGVESRNPSLEIAKTRNDQAIAAILKATLAEAVAPADVQTDFIEINPVYQERSAAESRGGRWPVRCSPGWRGWRRRRWAGDRASPRWPPPRWGFTARQ